MKQRTSLLGILMISAVLLLAACTKKNLNAPSPPPPTLRACATGKECLLLRATANPACGWTVDNEDTGRFGRLSRDLVTRQFEAFNLHASKDMLVILRTRIETQAPNPPTETLTPLLLKALPKGAIKGGPEGIDFAGDGTFLGCEYVKNGTLIQKYEFIADKICFVGDPDCAIAPPYAKPEQRSTPKEEVARCDVACRGNDPSKCLKYPELSGPGLSDLRALQAGLLNSRFPFTVDLTPLLNVLSAQSGPVCDPRILLADTSKRFSAFGPACRTAISTPAATPPALRSIVVDVSTSLAGSIQRYSSSSGGSTTNFALLQFEPAQSLVAEYYSPTGSVVDVDYLATASVTEKVITLAGKKSFCAVLPIGSDANADGRRRSRRPAG